MLKQRIAILVATGALLAGLGVASAFADDQRPPQATATATTTEVQDEQGQDEQGAANDVTEAADEVETEAANPTADDVQGDQQDENDQGDDGTQDGD